MKLEKIYERHTDDRISVTKIYFNMDEDPELYYAYADRECTEKLDWKTLKDAVIHGSIIVGVYPEDGNDDTYDLFYWPDMMHGNLSGEGAKYFCVTFDRATHTIYSSEFVRATTES